MRTSLRKRYLSQLTRRTRTWSADELAAPAIVIAPHPDEETLGCGATIAAKRSAGASIQVLFLTDGCRQTPDEAERNKLRQLRHQEAIAAAQALGLAPGDVHFLDYPNGDLIQHRFAAVAHVREILLKHAPRQAFVPFRGDSTRDHVAASRIFYDAADALEQPLDVYEYPVWFWSRWPWSPTGGAADWRKFLAHTRDAARSSWAVCLCSFTRGAGTQEAGDGSPSPADDAAQRGHRSKRRGIPAGLPGWFRGISSQVYLTVESGMSLPDHVSFPKKTLPDCICPNCLKPGAEVFYRVDAVPVHSCLLMATREEALSFLQPHW